jgi:hypothetical protein
MIVVGECDGWWCSAPASERRQGALKDGRTVKVAVCTEHAATMDSGVALGTMMGKVHAK